MPEINSSQGTEDDFAEFAHRKAEFQAMLDRGERIWFCKPGKSIVEPVAMAPEAISNTKAISMENERPFTTTGDAVEAEPKLIPNEPIKPLPAPACPIPEKTD